MEEEWRDIKGYEGLYQISNTGKVKSLKRKYVLKDRILKPSSSRYLEVGLSKGSPRREKNFRIHILVVEHFIGIKKGLTVNHKDGNKKNNYLKNLELITRRQNARHAWLTGLNDSQRTNSVLRKLKQQDIEEIKNSSLRRVELSKIYKVSRQTIDNIINNKTYKYGF